jgi:hypothetical protein
VDIVALTKCAETHLRASVSSKHFPGLYHRTPVLKGKGGEGRQKGVRLEGMEGRECEGKKDDGEGMAGRGGRGKGRRIVKAGAP